MEDLTKIRCIPCRGGLPALTQAEIESYQPQIPEWEVFEEAGIKRLRRMYKFKNFTQALAFTNRIGQLADEEDHHPVLQTEWGKVTVVFWTHAIKGLHQNDFIMAAKTDECFRKES